MSDDETKMYDEMRKNGANIPSWWGKPTPGANVEYAIHFSSSDTNYSYAYCLGTFSTEEEADTACDEYKTGKRNYTITGRDGTEMSIDKLIGGFKVSKQHDCYYK